MYRKWKGNETKPLSIIQENFFSKTKLTVDPVNESNMK